MTRKAYPLIPEELQRKALASAREKSLLRDSACEVMDVDQAESAVLEWLEHRFSLPDNEIDDLLLLLGALQDAAKDLGRDIERLRSDSLQAEVNRLNQLVKQLLEALPDP